MNTPEDNLHVVDEHTQQAQRVVQVPHVPHYYGDRVRELFVGISVLIGLLLPFSGNLEMSVIFGGAAVIILVALAGFTSPRGTFVFLLDAIAAGIGVLVSEFFAVASYASGHWAVFSVLELITILFVIALYFSAKDLRAMAAHQIGHIDKGDDLSNIAS